MKNIIIGNREVGSGVAPFIIAEMSGNHNQSLDEAIAIVEAAAKAGVDALKLQTYTADTMTLDVKDGDFFISDKSSLWYGHSLYELYQKAYTPWEWHKPIMEKCKQIGILCFSTPFDETAVNFLETLNVPCYKIASFENVHLSLIEKVAKTGKPLIISTGMASVSEIQDAVETARKAGCKDLILMKCNSGYPANPAETNVTTIPHMSQLFKCHVGLSDHSLGIGVALAGVAVGAVAIEKHFIVSDETKSVDSDFSMSFEEMKMLVEESKKVQMALGEVAYGPTERELSSLVFRRSLYIAKDLKAGAIISRDDVRVVRPGNGLKPKFESMLLGKKVTQDIKRGTPVSWNLVE